CIPTQRVGTRKLMSSRVWQGSGLELCIPSGDFLCPTVQDIARHLKRLLLAIGGLLGNGS
ncbi:MAG: hypothetical protein WAW41_08605, partial [Methylobacter sp.]